MESKEKEGEEHTPSLKPYDRLYEPPNLECSYKTMMSECRALVKGINEHLWSFLVVAKKLPGITVGPAIKPLTNHGSIIAVREYTEFVETKVETIREGEVDESVCSVCGQEFTVFSLRFRYDCTQCERNVCDDCCVQKEPNRICINCSRRADAERRTELYEIFDFLDSNDDGQISVAELKNGLERVNCELKLEDTFSDGNVSVTHDAEYQLNFMEFVEIAETQSSIMPALKKLQKVSIQMLHAKYWECPHCKTKNASSQSLCSNENCNCQKSQVEERVKERLGIILYVGVDCNDLMEAFWKNDYMLTFNNRPFGNKVEGLEHDDIQATTMSDIEFRSRIQADEASQLNGELEQLRKQLSAARAESARRMTEVKLLKRRTKYLEREMAGKRRNSSTWDRFWSFMSPLNALNCETDDMYKYDTYTAADETDGETGESNVEYRVTCKDGVCYRRSPNLEDRVEPKAGVHLNEHVIAVEFHGEHWIKVYEGFEGFWLPLRIDGEPLFELISRGYHHQIGEEVDKELDSRTLKGIPVL